MRKPTMQKAKNAVPLTNINLKLHDPEQHLKIMQKFKECVLKQADCDTNKPLSPSHIALIEKRLLDAFPAFHHTPTHPTYHAMIETSIVELQQEGIMATEELISECITKHYKGLPWAHRRYLSYHLSRLCGIGEIVSVTGGYYALPGKLSHALQKKKKKLKRKLIHRKKKF